jgi:catechol 2,3-dioxygenase
MTTTFIQPQTAVQKISPATRLGPVHYTTANLERQVAFYRDVLGFQLHWRDGASAGLGAGGEDLLRLTEQPGARRVRGTTGLYHTAFLAPTRWDLANLLRRLAETRTPIQGLMDHGTHQAIYLPDAEGNGIELAWDFPRERWPRTTEEMMRKNRAAEPQEILSALTDRAEPWTGIDPGTKIGHVHLHVADLDATDRFYRQTLGFGHPYDLSGWSAVFFAAGDYHHHIGTNIWNGAGAPRPPADAIGLRWFTITLPDAAELNRVVEQVRAAGAAVESSDGEVLLRDPAGNGVRLVAEGEAA